MKKSLFILFCLFYLSLSIKAQEDIDIQQPQAGKCNVYFTRTSSMALLINFKIFDSENFIGKLKPNNFIVYECDPGEHIFIAKSENTDYLEANLEAGKVYIVNVEPQSGIIKARVKFKPLDKLSKKYEKEKKSILKLLAKDNKGNTVSEVESDNNEEETDETPSKTLQKFWKKKQKNDKITQLTAEMFFE